MCVSAHFRHTIRDMHTLWPVIWYLRQYMREMTLERYAYVVDGFDGDGLAIESHLVRFHDFLDACADVVHASIDAGFLKGSVSDTKILNCKHAPSVPYS